MGYGKLPTKAWKDPLGPTYLGYMRGNIGGLQYIASAEHIISSGEHNAREIPRVVRTILTTGPAVSPSSSDITAVSKPATGRYVLTLAAGRFTAPDIRVQINPTYSSAIPTLAGYKIISSTSIEVYTLTMTAAVGVDGSGNIWAPTDMNFHIAIHSTPLAVGSWNAFPGPFVRGANGGGLIGTATSPVPAWSQYVQEMSELQRVLLAAHDSAGEHQVREVAKVSGLIRWNGSTYTSTSPYISSITRSSAGVITVTHSAVSASTQPKTFVMDLGRAGASNLWSSAASSTSTAVVMFSYNAGTSTWNFADGDLYLVVHDG